MEACAGGVLSLALLHENGLGREDDRGEEGEAGVLAHWAMGGTLDLRSTSYGVARHAAFAGIHNNMAIISHFAAVAHIRWRRVNPYITHRIASNTLALAYLGVVVTISTTMTTTTKRIESKHPLVRPASPLARSRAQCVRRAIQSVWHRVPPYAC